MDSGFGKPRKTMILAFSSLKRQNLPRLGAVRKGIMTTTVAADSARANWVLLPMFR
jgi:hypothetical protein